MPQQVKESEGLGVLRMSNLLALDQSSHITGYAVFKNNKPIEVNHFSAEGKDLGERLEYIRNKVISLIKEYEIDEVAFEDIQLQSINGNKELGIKTFKMLAEVFGVLHELMEELDIKYSIVPPITWKASFKIAGKGRAAEKKASQKYVLDTYGLKCTEDEADATCIGAHVLKKQNEEFDWS